MISFNFCFAITLVTFAHSLFDPTAHPNWRLVNDKTCGLQGQMRIFGGRDAGLGEFPWMVLVIVTTHYEKGEMMNLCGGSLINEKYVLTAAHCVVKVEPVTMKVRVGEYNLKEDPDCERNQCAPKHIEYYTTEMHAHPDYRRNINGSSLDPLGDLALLRSQQPFVFNDFIRPICLEYGYLLNQDYSGQMAKIIGYGSWDFLNGMRPLLSYPRRLQKASVRVSNKVTCAKFLVELHTTRSQPPQYHICAGNQTTFSYVGDSGSPMFIAKSVNGDFARNYLIAVTSVSFSVFTDPGGMRRPSIYVRVGPHLEWILNMIRD